MLDLSKIAQQMQGISTHLAKEAEAARARVAIATQLLHQAHLQQSELVQQLHTHRPQIGFAAAEPMEPLDTRVQIKPAPEAHTVIATDGSQINPSHHEIAYCYLLNIGRVVLHYGQSRFPLLDSQPEVIYRPEDLYASRQWGIRTEEWMGYRRTVSEAVVLAELGAELGTELGVNATAGRPGQLTLLQRSAPTLAMTDGSLIYWFLDQLPAPARDQILEPILTAWECLRVAQVPMVGYLSASRSSEALNFLRLQSCSYDQPDCQKYCEGQTDGAPCQIFSPLRDVTLWSTLLEPGQRGPLFKSSADILHLYGDHQVYFCHVHVGAEIARVEFPEWVVNDRQLFEAALSLTLTQVQKGFGYPVTLAEAHNQAVVKGGDRNRFFALLEQQMLRAGLQNVGTSYKEARKRGSIA
ncbi:MAG: DNA double-strand break repair nuclease NurA [Leptolyngbyaceae cyanobacterium MAG.088]|nr:DNA double-strand break repair nuclease NurA [Leptolyngbyaceae cyanobacterium MAG.088]